MRLKIALIWHSKPKQDGVLISPVFVLGRICVFLVLFFVFSSVVTPSLPAHTPAIWNPAFSLFTACSPMHIHVTARYIVGYGPDNVEMFESEKQQGELTAVVKRRLVTARLYQERAENYVKIEVMRQPDGTFSLEFDFQKLLYDRATQSWDYASTWNFYSKDSSESLLTSTLSSMFDIFLEQYVDANKNSCSP